MLHRFNMLASLSEAEKNEARTVSLDRVSAAHSVDGLPDVPRRQRADSFAAAISVPFSCGTPGAGYEPQLVFERRFYGGETPSTLPANRPEQLRAGSFYCFRSFSRRTNFSPDQIPVTAHTFTSTRPVETNLAHDVFIKVGRHAGAFLRPTYPQHSCRSQNLRDSRELVGQLRSRFGEDHHKIQRGPSLHDVALSQRFAQLRADLCRTVRQMHAKPWLDS